MLVLFKKVLSACPFGKTTLLLYLVVKVVVMVAVNMANIIVLLILIVNTATWGIIGRQQLSDSGNFHLN